MPHYCIQDQIKLSHWKCKSEVFPRKYSITINKNTLNFSGSQISRKCQIKNIIKTTIHSLKKLQSFECLFWYYIVLFILLESYIKADQLVIDKEIKLSVSDFRHALFHVNNAIVISCINTGIRFMHCQIKELQLHFQICKILCLE